MSKTKEKSIEELLEEALVPEEEQPYEVPENWIWVKLESVHDIITGSTPSKKVPQYYGGSFPIIKPGDLDQGDSVILASEYLSDEGKAKSRIIPRNSTLVCCIGSIGKAGFTLVDCTTNQQINSLVAIKNTVVPKYTYYFSLSESFRQALISRSSSTTISIINKFKMGQIPFPLPPYSEQRKISKEIDSLFAKIDEAKRLIDQAKESFELRRASILDKAFRGELTREWRESRQCFLAQPLKDHLSLITNAPYVLPLIWDWVYLEDVCDKITDGTHHSPESFPVGKYKYITAKNIKESGISLDDITYVPEEVHREIFKRCDVRYKDILYIKDGATTGVATINNLKEEFSLLSSVGVLRTKSSILNPEYLVYCLNSPNIKKMMLNLMTGSAIKRLTLTKIKKGIIPLPPIEEQNKIVDILKTLFKNEEVQANNIPDKELGRIKQSILMKAFRGELGTNNSSEKSSIDLLIQELKEKSN
ncbi:hypothetical protein LK13_17345 [Paenibacillus polymyxa]|uniref:restriction endonuclease subunit S n=1 Tax=Paenibacillus polymyxa TaxID=1406 RepID=UPI00042EBAEE|nr:restriction endonuclease subunit S [Paenibacillus polymyxa]AHM64545.1 restriction modification system DNA specificity domain protein [Paenibacillus polymyxa SQR-21]AIY10192.1 hypothetical protein LK13_17345 [Paenibacillus polymyxa]